MLIGIDASRAVLKKRTGIEEYSYQTIKHLRTTLPATDSVVLYVRKKLRVKKGWLVIETPEIGFDLPENWQVRGIWAPRFWTQIGLSLEMLFRCPDVLFVPAHTVPLIHPKKTVVTVHGLEYEFCPEAYSFAERLYMRFFIRHSCRVASTVICVSENTKKDVMRLYGTPEEKMRVVYEGYSRDGKIQDTRYKIQENTKPYLLFVGRLEERKNIVRIVEAFEILKDRRQIPHQLVLVGKPGYGYEKIESKIQNLKSKIPIEELGYVSEEEKWGLLRGAEAFLFPTLYEGFGIPVLEAQAVSVPVVTSDISSLPEVGGEGAVYVDPTDAENIAEGIWSLLSDRDFRDGILERAGRNVARFSWEQCASSIAGILRSDC